MAFNPLPWFMTPEGWREEFAPPLPVMLAAVKAAGFDAIHAEIPTGIAPTAYLALLRDHGLDPAPGYFQASFSGPAAGLVESARRVAADHAALGLEHIFLAEQFGAAPARLETPAKGVEANAGRLAAIADGIGRAAEAMTAEGVCPCLHQHIGTWIETESETEGVLAAVPSRVLAVGPDTGHLAWAGIDPVSFIERHRIRVGAIHIKDIRKAVAREPCTYLEAGARRLWTEPGRGDIDFDSVFAALAGFDGWFVVEVDIADQATVEQSARVSADWLRPRLAGGVRS